MVFSADIEGGGGADREGGGGADIEGPDGADKRAGANREAEGGACRDVRGGDEAVSQDVAVEVWGGGGGCQPPSMDCRRLRHCSPRPLQQRESPKTCLPGGVGAHCAGWEVCKSG